MVGDMKDTPITDQSAEKKGDTVTYFAIKGLCVWRTSSISMSIKRFPLASRPVVTARTPLRISASANRPVLYLWSVHIHCTESTVHTSTDLG